LRCSNPQTKATDIDPGFIEPLSTEEGYKLKQAPHGARRIGVHQIEISWVAGKRIFRDKPPFNEPLDGIHWTYCGYNSELKLHMLIKEDGSLFTGALLDELTGAVLPGGQTILFSKNSKYYIAYEQPDGQDGETIKLYQRDGKLLWKGYNGILSPDKKMVLANFENMHWDNQNRPQAVAQINGHNAQTITLTPDSSGKWNWLPQIK
jgi:hypothetical protein